MLQFHFIVWGHIADALFAAVEQPSIHFIHPSIDSSMQVLATKNSFIDLQYVFFCHVWLSDGMLFRAAHRKYMSYIKKFFLMISFLSHSVHNIVYKILLPQLYFYYDYSLNLCYTRKRMKVALQCHMSNVVNNFYIKAEC